MAAKSRSAASEKPAHSPQSLDWVNGWRDARAQAEQAFTATQDVAVLWRALTQACDRALTQLFAPQGNAICVVAVGSYGNSELLPHSDIDLLILTPDEPPATLADTVTQLWSSGLRIGHGVHTPASAIAAMDQDMATLTSYLHPRYVCGDKALCERFVRRKNTWRSAGNVTARIDRLMAHRDARHQRFGDSRFLLEPHMKDGKGGMRDAQLLGWLAYLAFGTRELAKKSDDALWPESSAASYVQAYRFFARTRACLHIITGRGEERLVFDAQLRIADMLGYDGATPESRAQNFMAEYFHCTRIIGERTRELCTMLDRHSKRTPPFRMAEPAVLPDGLCWRDGRIAITADEPAPMILPLFAEATSRGRDVHPDAMHWIHAHREALAHYFAHTLEASVPLRDMLLSTNPELVLRRLNEAGVLAMIVPEFAHVSGQMQYDGYHTYTVDAHILLVIGNVHALERGAMMGDAPVTTRAAKYLVNRRALYVAALCHDLAKGTGGGHQDKGVVIVTRVAAQLGLNDAETALAGWLVKYHQHLSDMAFKRDIDDPETIATLAALVQSPERLRLLMVLTVADIRAVGPSIWNGWKASVLRKLFERTMDAMGVRLDSYTESAPLSAALSDSDRATLHADGMLLSTNVRDNQSVTEVLITAPYDRSLLRRAAGALAYIGANIVSARSTMLDEYLCRLTFVLQDGSGRAFTEEQRFAQLTALITTPEPSRERFEEALAKRGYVRSNLGSVAVHPAVFFDQDSSSTATLVEVNAADRSGLLYDILRVFEASGTQVSGAYIATYGQRVVDVFYMKDRFGLKLRSAGKLSAIQHALLEVL